MLGHAQTLSLEALDARVVDFGRSLRIKAWVPFLVNSATGVLLAWWTGNAYCLGLIGAGAFISGVVLFRAGLTARRHAKVARSPVDVRSFYRGLLEAQVRRLRWIPPMVTVFAAAWLAFFGLARPVQDVPLLVIIGAPMLGAVAFLWFLRLRKTPRLEKELKGLDRP